MAFKAGLSFQSTLWKLDLGVARADIYWPRFWIGPYILIGRCFGPRFGFVMMKSMPQLTNNLRHDIKDFEWKLSLKMLNVGVGFWGQPKNMKMSKKFECYFERETVRVPWCRCLLVCVCAFVCLCVCVHLCVCVPVSVCMLWLREKG